MLCLRCEKKVEGSYCNRCFVFIIEKRLKKSLRDSGLLKPGIHLYTENAYVKAILQKIVNMPVVFVKKKTKKTIYVTLNTLDDMNVAFFADYLGLKKEKKQRAWRNIALFQHITDDEAVRYFALLKKKFQPKQHPLKKSLQTFFAKYPETRYALHQASEEYAEKLDS